MNQQYEDYIASPQWQAKREAKFRQVGRKCESCNATHTLEVHHLTYERIFKEDLNDLMVLCFYHHSAIEECASCGEISKYGNPSELRKQTLNLLSTFGSRKPTKKLIDKPSNRTQERLLTEPWFIETLKFPRQQFKDVVKKKHKEVVDVKYGVWMANATTIYDRIKRCGKKPNQDRINQDSDKRKERLANLRERRLKKKEAKLKKNQRDSFDSCYALGIANGRQFVDVKINGELVRFFRDVDEPNLASVLAHSASDNFDHCHSDSDPVDSQSKSNASGDYIIQSVSKNT